MSVPDWLREAEESVKDGGIIAGPRARRLLALVRKMGEALEAIQRKRDHRRGCERCQNFVYCAELGSLAERESRALESALHAYRHGPEVDEG